MRRLLVVLCTLLMLLVFSIPAVAVDVNLSINGNSYQPLIMPKLQEGTTMVPLYLVDRISGANSEVSGDKITIKKGTDTLVLAVNQTKADLNGNAIVLPQAPTEVNGEIMVPIRVIMEGLDAVVDWDQGTRTVSVTMAEKNQKVSTTELYAKSNAAMESVNQFRAKADLEQKMQMVNPQTTEVENVDIQMVMDMAMQNEPILLYAKTSATLVGQQIPEEDAVETEMVINEEGMYMTMPEYGWVKLEIPGMDIKSLIEESRQDPLKSLDMVNKADIILSLSDDEIIDANSYWVLNVTIGPEGFRQMLNEIMEQIPIAPLLPAEANAAEEFSAIYQDLLANLKADIFFKMWIDQNTYFPKYMDVSTKMDIQTEIPAPTSEEDSVLIDMSIMQNGSYEYYDLDKPFAVPDVSDAKDFADILNCEVDIEVDQVPVNAG